MSRTAAGRTTRLARRVLPTRWPSRRRLVIIATAGGAIAWIAFTGIAVARALVDARSAVSEADRVRVDLTRGTIAWTQSMGALTKVRQRLAAAQGELSSPALAPLTIVPWVGTQVRSARSIVAGGERLAAVAERSVGQADAALRQDHGPGPDRVQALHRVADIADAARSSLAGLRADPSAGLLGPLAARRAQLLQDVAKARDGLYRSAAAAEGAADLLDAPHQYLVLAANNAEMRAGSGIFLQGGVLTTGGGRMQLGAMQPLAGQPVPSPGAPVPPELAARWGPLRPGVYFQNLAVTPQVDVTGPLAAQMWKLYTGQTVDGVIVLDIEALHQLLKATGPVSAEGSRVDGLNVVKLLMHDQYMGVTGLNDQNAVRRDKLGALARAAIGAADSDGSKLEALGTDLARAADGRHIMIWSAQPDLEAMWRRAGAAGELGGNDLLASVVNLGTNKLDWFLDVSDTIQARREGTGVHVTLRVHLKNRTPPGEPRYVAGPSVPIDLGATPQPVGPAGQYVGLVAVNLPQLASGESVEGQLPSELATHGQEGPTTLVAVRVKLQAGEAQDVTLHFQMPGKHGELRVIPSARVPSVSWTGAGTSFTDSHPRTVSW